MINGFSLGKTSMQLYLDLLDSKQNTFGIVNDQLCAGLWMMFSKEGSGRVVLTFNGIGDLG